jgi:ankyrin repeat protein
MNAVRQNNTALFIYLAFEKEADLTKIDNKGNNLLHIAAEHDSIDIIKFLQQV